MKKILVIDLNGTSSVYTHYFAQGLKNNLTEVSILGKKKPEFLGVFENTNRYLGFKTGIKLIDYIINWIWLLLNFRTYDLIIIQWIQLLKYISFEVYLIKHLQKKVKLLYVTHNLYPHNSKNTKVIRRYNFLYNTCKNIAVHTNEMKLSISKLNPKANILKINHGLFFKEFRDEKSSNNSSSCLLVGYISKYKGVEDAIDVVKKLKDDNNSISLNIIGLGDPKYVNELNERIDLYDLNDLVSITSREVPTTYLIKKIKEASMLWLPYKNISQSGVAYTATGLGVPFVGYDVGNFKEVFGENYFAEIVEKNNLDEFCLAVKKVLDKNTLYKAAIRKNLKNDLWVENRNILEKLF